MYLEFPGKEVDAIIFRILEVRTCQATRNLCEDIRIVQRLKGDMEAVAMGEIVLEGVKKYEAEDKWLKAGAKTGERP